MRFKEFIRFDKQKLVSLLFLMFFAPLPMFLMIVGGLAPPITILILFWELATESLVTILTGPIVLLIFLIVTLFVYLMSCFVMWVIRKITHEGRKQWIILIVFGVLLAIISFSCPLYYMAGPGGGGQRLSSYDLYVKTLGGLFVKFLPKVLGCEFARIGLKDSCYYDKAIKVKEASLCGKIQKEQMEINCYDTLAKIKNDPRICDLIESSINRWGCVASIAQSNNDEKICDYLRPSDDKKSCISQARIKH